MTSTPPHRSNWLLSWGKLLLWVGLASCLALGPAREAWAQDPAAERLLAEAERLEKAQNYPAARDEYALLVQQFPTDRLAPRALLATIRLDRARGDEASARRAIERLLNDFARSPEAASAFLIQGEAQAQAAQTPAALEEARATLRRIPLLYGRERFKSLEARTQAWLRAGEISLLLGDFAAAERDFLAVIEDEKVRSIGQAQLSLATVWLARGDWKSAAELLQQVQSAPPDAATDADREQARRRLSLIRRRLLGPQVGSGHWQRTDRFQPVGLSLKAPTGIAAADNNDLVIVDPGAPLVAYLDASGKVLASRALEEVERPGFSREGKPYVVSPTGVWLVFSGEQVDFRDPRPGKDGPLKGTLAAEPGPLGDWFAVAKGFKSLLRFDAGRQGWVNLLADQEPELVDLAGDLFGRLYALNRKTAQVIRIGVDRSYDVVVRGTWKKPAALAVDALGFLYVLDRAERQIELYNPQGERQATLGPILAGGIELRSPEDLAVDGSGRLWIVDSKLPFVIRVD